MTSVFAVCNDYYSVCVCTCVRDCVRARVCDVFEIYDIVFDPS